LQNNGNGDKHVDKHANKQTKDAKKKPRKFVLSQQFLDYCQHEPFTFVPTTQHKHGDGDDDEKTNEQTTYRMKIRRKEERAVRDLALLTIINLHILLLFL
jgi:hypothetical protein